MKSFLLVNFGGPRDLHEIPAFLHELLLDRDVIRSRLPRFAHDWLFSRVARKRSCQIKHDYEVIGGKSPIYEDTEKLAELLSEKLGGKVATFHRYLPSTHLKTLTWIKENPAQEIIVLPLFPQFCYATTGSIARFFQTHLSVKTVCKLRWIKSYAAHPAFIAAFCRRISDFLSESHLTEEQTALLFSAHGVPKQFIDEGDLYESECRLSFQQISRKFPQALSHLAYQSQFGRGEWIGPSTRETCEQAPDWRRSAIVFVPLSFTSDHIETLFEIEKLYLPLIAKNHLKAYRCPALNLQPYWLNALSLISQEPNFCSTQMLIRP